MLDQGVDRHDEESPRDPEQRKQHANLDKRQPRDRQQHRKYREPETNPSGTSPYSIFFPERIPARALPTPIPIAKNARSRLFLSSLSSKISCP